MDFGTKLYTTMKERTVCIVYFISITIVQCRQPTILVFVCTLQMALSVFGGCGGPLAGLFFLGGLVPKANWIVSILGRCLRRRMAGSKWMVS